MTKQIGCEYGRTNRIYINEIRDDIKIIKDNTNHFSQRLPVWASALITILTSISVGLIVWAATK